MSKISVIIPVYNTEKYLKLCLDSVLNQTLKDIKIICVNDGSTDNSLSILQEYANKDDRVTLISKENGGLSSARNAGLEKVNSDYVFFLDSDDTIEIDTLEIMYNKMIKNDVDVVICDVNCINEKDINPEIRENKQNWFLRFKNIEGKHEIPLDVKSKICSVAWNKLYKMSIIKEHDLKFDLGFVNEDEGFIWYYMLNCKSYYYVDKKLNNYLLRNKSIVMQINGTLRSLDILKIYKLVFEYIKQHRNIELYRQFLETYYIRAFNSIFKREKVSIVKEAFRVFKDYAFEVNQSDEIKNNYYRFLGEYVNIAL